MIRRKICVVITARPSYSRVKTVLHAVNSNPYLTLQLIVGASALSNKYGNMAEVIQNDGFDITAKVYNSLDGEGRSNSAKTTGLGILELSTIFENIQPDIVLTIADRFETMSTAIAAAYMNIPLAHLQGGEVTGNIDEKVRHAITKLADYHLVASEDAYARVLRLGENPKYILNTGCPSIDLANEVKINPNLNFNPNEKYGGVGNEIDFGGDYLVVLQHPVTNEYGRSKNQIEETLFALHDLQIPTFWFWPNIDSGSDGTSKGIRSFREKYDSNFRFIKNMESLDFLRLVFNSACLVGNSSVGIRECSFLGIPVVNIGSRQHRRLRGGNTIEVGYDKNEIKSAINKILNTPRPKPSDVYGGGKAGQMIADFLEKVELVHHKTILF